MRVNNTTETFQKWSVYDTQAIFSMALICWQSWMQPKISVFSRGPSPFTSLCSSQHSNRWNTQRSNERLLWHKGTITCWWRLGFVQEIQTLQLTDNIQKGSQNETGTPLNFSVQMWPPLPIKQFIVIAICPTIMNMRKKSLFHRTKVNVRRCNGTFSDWELGTFYLLWWGRSLNKQMDKHACTRMHALTHEHTWSIIHAVGCP